MSTVTVTVTTEELQMIVSALESRRDRYAETFSRIVKSAPLDDPAVVRYAKMIQASTSLITKLEVAV